MNTPTFWQHTTLKTLALLPLSWLYRIGVWCDRETTKPRIAPIPVLSVGNATVGGAWNRFWFTPSSAATVAMIRIAAGLLALYAVATYSPDLELWFGEGGMLPLEMVRSLYDGQFSLLDYTPPSMLRACTACTSWTPAPAPPCGSLARTAETRPPV